MALVEPKDSAPAAPPAVEPSENAPSPAPAPAEGKPTSLSPELLKIPAIMGVFAGKPAAVSAPIAEFSKRPEAKLIVSHVEQLQKAGIGLYRSLDGSTGVVFNSLHVHPEELKEADMAGQLEKLAPSFDAVNHSVATSHPSAHPVLSHNGVVPMAPKSAPVPSVPQSGSPIVAQAPTDQPPASVQNKMATARNTALQPGAPTSGSNPGSGNLLRAILKPVL